MMSAFVSVSLREVLLLLKVIIEHCYYMYLLCSNMFYLSTVLTSLLYQFQYGYFAYSVVHSRQTVYSEIDFHMYSHITIIVHARDMSVDLYYYTKDVLLHTVQ